MEEASTVCTAAMDVSSPAWLANYLWGLEVLRPLTVLRPVCSGMAK
jgi:hypothetical protein